MTWRTPALGFGLRLLICLLLVGSLYGGWRYAKARSAPVTPALQKTAALRGQLQENLLRGTTLVDFQLHDATADDTLQRLVTELDNSDNSLHKAATADTALTPAQNQAVNRLLDMQQQTISQYRAAHQVLGKIIGYDPAVDLSSLDPAKDAAELTGRAAAAARGLSQAANSTVTSGNSGSPLSVGSENGPAPLVSSASKPLLAAAAGCFQTLSTTSGAQPLAAQRTACTNTYPRVRATAVTNLLEDSFNADYSRQLKELVEPLLKQLDQQLKRAA